MVELLDEFEIFLQEEAMLFVELHAFDSIDFIFLFMFTFTDNSIASLTNFLQELIFLKYFLNFFIIFESLDWFFVFV